MKLRMFLLLQLLMFLILFLVSPMLSDIDELAAVVLLDFAVFYLSSLFVGYLVKHAPVSFALATNIVFNLISYVITFAAGQGGTVSLKLVSIDIVTMVIFTVIGTYVGIRSRVVSGDENTTWTNGHDL
ncbi:MAG TPA: hypothetical protein VFF14_00710 [Candidatus Deferrimicrobium sp.]|nr:hypothetical protein [Candidatus Deferrimicrobium sp.]